jgi:hypothetical protein
VLLRLAYLTVTNAFGVLRPLPMSDRDKDAEILALLVSLATLNTPSQGSSRSQSRIATTVKVHYPRG